MVTPTNDVSGSDAGRAAPGWADVGDVAGVAVTSVIARAAAPLALIAISRGESETALATAAAVGGFGVLRGIVGGRAMERAERRAWALLVAAIGRSAVAKLRVRSVDESAATFAHAAVRIAQFRAAVVPGIIADSLCLVVVAIATAVFVSVSWLVFGIAIAAGLAALVAAAHRRLRGAERAGWDRYPEILRDMTVLIDGSVEVRAQGREAALNARLLSVASAKAAFQRRATTTSAMLGLLPLAIALAVLAVSALPFGLLEGQGAQMGGGLVGAAVLGGAAVLFGMSLSRNLEAMTRSEPQRRLFARITQASTTTPPREGEEADMTPPDDLDRGPVRFEGVSIRYPDTDVFTPSRFACAWEDGRGLALLGPNGAGKTSLALALVGLVRPTEGRISTPGSDRNEPQFRDVVFLPQQPLLVPTESIRWHLTDFGTSSARDEDLEQALRRFELWERLEHRASGSPLDVPAGDLSGGERQRMELARTLLLVDGHRPDLIVLDEPEAGLDAGAREVLRGVLSERARETRVLLIAHDPGVVPADFQRAFCERSDAETVAESHVRELGDRAAESTSDSRRQPG